MIVDVFEAFVIHTAQFNEVIPYFCVLCDRIEWCLFKDEVAESDKKYWGLKMVSIVAPWICYHVLLPITLLASEFIYNSKWPNFLYLCFSDSGVFLVPIQLLMQKCMKEGVMVYSVSTFWFSWLVDGWLKNYPSVIVQAIIYHLSNWKIFEKSNQYHLALNIGLLDRYTCF